MRQILTLEDAKKNRLEIIAVCRNVNCRHRGTVDLDTLIHNFGLARGLLPVRGEVHGLVYLWTRDHSLCAGPKMAGPKFDRSLTEGQLLLPGGTQCTVPGGRISTSQLSSIAHVTRDRQKIRELYAPKPNS